MLSWRACIRSTIACCTPRLSGYKALQSRGLHIISDDELRAATTDFYEVKLVRLAAYEQIALDTADRLEQSCLQFYSLRFSPPPVGSLLDFDKLPALAERVPDAKRFFASEPCQRALINMYRASRLVLRMYTVFEGEIEELKVGIRAHTDSLM